jgi:hypothetical protein
MECSGGPWSQLGALFINAHFLPSVCSGCGRAGTACFGSTIALKRSTLDAIGGLPRSRIALMTTTPIGAAVRERGEVVAIRHSRCASLQRASLHECGGTSCGWRAPSATSHHSATPDRL